MKTARLTVRLDVVLRERVRARAAALGMAESEYIRETLEKDAEGVKAGESVFDVWNRLGLIGVAKGLPADLSTNKKYMEGFGRPERWGKSPRPSRTRS